MVIPVFLVQRLRLDVLSGSDPRLGAALIVCCVTHFPYRPRFHYIVFFLPSLSDIVLWTLEVEVVVSVFDCTLHFLFQSVIYMAVAVVVVYPPSRVSLCSLVLCLAVGQPPLTRWARHTIPPRILFEKYHLKMLQHFWCYPPFLVLLTSALHLDH